ncbi:uncharacterized protein VP01_8942g2, partial [Puccinia sorghi]
AYLQSELTSASYAKDKFWCGYLASIPVYPQTEFLLRLLNFYHLLWNLSNATTTFFAEVLHQWNESLSVRLCSKNSIQPQRLAHNLSGSIEVYQLLVTKQQNLVETITSTLKQDLLTQQTCPACFGKAISTLTPHVLQKPPATPTATSILIHEQAQKKTQKQ